MNKQQIREPRTKSNTLTARRVAWDLSKLPDQLRSAELRRDTIRVEYESYLVGLSVDALSATIFPGKAPEEKRAAQNAEERKLAADWVIAQEPDFKVIREEYEAAQREVERLRGQQENLRIVAKLLIS